MKIYETKNKINNIMIKFFLFNLYTGSKASKIN